MRIFCTAVLVAAVCGASVIAVESKATDSELAATHKQTHRIAPEHDGVAAKLNTFCLDAAGNILACVGGSAYGLPGAAATPDLLQVYSPDGKLQRETALSFTPTAINVAPDGSVYVGGSGQVAHVSAEGEVLVTVDSPATDNPEGARNAAREAYEEQIKQMTVGMEKQLERLDTQVRKIEAIPEDERTERDERRLKSFCQQKEIYSQQLEQTTEMIEVMLSNPALMGGSQNITSLAVTSKDVFVCCGAAAGHGYEVWRTDRDLSSPTRVVDSLSGCCGQCDIQANDDYLVLAENSSFRVGLLDRDGKRIRNFGRQDRTSKTGFASCCNPMNVRCCSNGDILTAESSIGSIKRFNSDGELIGIVGKAKIGGGCKHVALGFDETRDRYYLQYEDRNQICVLVPLAEAPEFTEDELLAKAAREGLALRLLADGDQLTGQWSLDGKRPEPEQQSSGLFGLLGDLLGGSEEVESVQTLEDEVAADVVAEAGSAAIDLGDEALMADAMDEQQPVWFHFHSDGRLEVTGGYFAHFENASWEAVKQDLDKETLRFSYLSDGIQYYDFQVQFQTDLKAKISMLYGDQVMASAVYHRIADDSADNAADRDVVETLATEEDQ